MRRNHTHCRYHCRACGSHFGALEAFDAHRIFADGHPGDWKFRCCAEPSDIDRFEAADRNGICRLTGMGESIELQPVTVWRLRKPEANWERLRAMKRRQDSVRNA